MRYHFSITFSGDFTAVNDWLRERAADDPLVAVAKGPRDYYHIVVTNSPEFAAEQQQQFDAGRGAHYGVCDIEVAPEHSLLRVNLECGDQERKGAEQFLGALLKKFPNYSVYDEDAGEDLTDQVRKDPGFLFQDG